MKKQSFLSVILFLPIILFAQNELTITLTKRAGNLQASVTQPSHPDKDGKYGIDFSNGGTITIKNISGDNLNANIKIQNSETNSDIVFSLTNKTFTPDEVYAIPFSNSVTITAGTAGATGKEVKNRWKIIFGTQSFSIVGKTTPANTTTASIPQGVQQQSTTDSRQSTSDSTTQPASSSPTGLIYWDAKTLVDPNTTRTTALAILSYYTSLDNTKTNLSTWVLAKNFYTENSFLEEYINNEEIANPDPKKLNSGNPTVNMFSSALSSIGNLNITNIADGFAKFIVKRAKEELDIAFFQKFDTAISKYPDLQTVFPQTYTALSAMGDQIYYYDGYIKTLRESFEKDLSALPDNLPTIIDNHKAFFDSFPDIKAMLQSGFYIAQQIQDKQHPGSIIENYPIDYLDNVDPDVKASFQTMILLSSSLKNKTATDTSKTYWASFSDIKKLFANDDRLLNIYLGLLEQEAKLQSITFKNGKHLSDIIDASYSPINKDLPQYKSYIRSVALKTQSLETKIKVLNKTDNDSLKLENYYSIISNSLDLMKMLTQAENLPHFPTGLDIQNKTKKYFDIAQSTSNIVIDVNRRSYSSAIVNLVRVYDSTFTKDNSEISKAIFKYGSFMAAMAQAKSSDDVEDAIEAVALPVGSFTIKRETPFNVSLNSYGGFYYGHEYIKDVKDNLAFNTYGITAPIGVAISKGHRILPWPLSQLFKTKASWSSTWFISLVDLGAVAAYRVNNDKTAQVPTIQLKDIFSPGLIYAIGIPKTPLSFNLGGQLGPNLRRVNDNNNDYSNKTYFRLSASLVVDIPVFNFYTKSN